MRLITFSNNSLLLALLVLNVLFRVTMTENNTSVRETFPLHASSSSSLVNSKDSQTRNEDDDSSNLQRLEGRRLQSSPMPCADGQRWTGTACENCADGTYLSGASYASGASATTCIPCAEGRYGTGGTNQCSGPCDAGTYGTGPTASCAGQCGIGTYSSAGAGSCSNCPAGTSTASTGSTSSGACTDCAAGTYSTGNGGACLSLTCPAGKYAIAGAQSSTLTDPNICASCPAGTTSVSGSVAISACTTCNAGKYSLAGDSTCSNCPAGTYGTSSGSTTSACSGTCSAGKYSAAGSTSCTDCPAGSFSSSSGAGSCTSCTAGSTYQTEDGQTSCNACSSCGTIDGHGIVAIVCTTTFDTVCSSPTPSATTTSSSSPCLTPSSTASLSQSSAVTPTSSKSGSTTATATNSCSPTITSSNSGSPTATSSATTSGTMSRSTSPTVNIVSSSTSSGTRTLSTSSTATSSFSPTATISTSATPTVTSPPDVIICNFGSFLQSGSSQCTSCLANTYSYGGPSCSSCPSGSTFISSSLGCRPSLSSSSGPIDTSFYLSGSHSEGLSAFSNIVNTTGGLTYYTNSTAYPSSALVVSHGSYVSAPLLPSLPIDSSAFTVSSWVKCDASSLTDANPSNVVISWGSGGSSTSTGITSASLSVTSMERLPSPTVTVSTLAGSASFGSSDGTGTNAQFSNSFEGITVDPSGIVYTVDSNNNFIRKVTPDGVVSTFVGRIIEYLEGAEAYMSVSRGLSSDAFGNIFIAEYFGGRIRKVTPDGIVTTIAGGGFGFLSLDGTGTSAKFFFPFGIAVDVTGTVFVSEEGGRRIRTIASSGVVTTLAGDGVSGFADLIGTNARFSSPQGLVIDSNSNIFVADAGNHRIRKITPSGSVSTFAGSGIAGYADGIGTNAVFDRPRYVAIDTSGNFWVTDNSNRIRKITSSGVVSTFAGDEIACCGIATYKSKYLYINSNGRIRKITISPSLPGPLPVCDSTWHHIALTYSGSSTTTLTAYVDGSIVASSTSLTFDISSSSLSASTLRLGWNGLTPVSTAGELFSGSVSDLRVFSRALSGSEIVTLSQPLFSIYTNAINPVPAATSTSYIWYCSAGFYGPTVTLSRSSSDGTWSSSGGTVNCQSCSANTYSYSGASSCSSCPSGSTLVSSSLGCRPSTSTSSSPVDTSFYLSGSHSEGLSAFSNIVNTTGGLTYYTNSIAYPSSALVVSHGSYVSAPLSSSLPIGSSSFTVSSWVKCDASSYNYSNPSGVVTSWGLMQTSVSASLNAATLAVSYAGLLNSPIITVSTFAGSGTSGYLDGEGTNAMFTTPGRLVIDLQGNIFVAEFGQSVIRKISPSGVVSTLAGKSGTTAYADGIGTNAKFNNPNGIAIDSSGTIFVSDYHNCRIRKVTQLGNVTTLAGEGTPGFADGPGNNAKFNFPVGIVVDSFGNVLVSDKDNHCIRYISTTTGDVSTLAGLCGTSGLTDHTTKSNARFSSPNGLSLDSYGNIFVLEYGSHRVRKISASIDEVTTFAGSATGTSGFQDDTGTFAMFLLPGGISVDKVGNVYIGDSHNNRIRKISPDRVVTTIAGSSNPNFLDGTGTDTRFAYPQGLAVDSLGNLFIADWDNNRIRKITFSPSIPGPLPVCDSSWHHIALTYTGSSSTNTLTAYIDGDNVASSTSLTFAISSLSTSTLRIGWNGLTPVSTAGELFSGSVSDLRVYNRSLSSSEIKLLSARVTLSSPSPTPSATVTTSTTASKSASPTPSLSSSASPSTSPTRSSSASRSGSLTSSPTRSTSTSASPSVTSSHTRSGSTSSSPSVSTTTSSSPSGTSSPSVSTTTSSSPSATESSSLSSTATESGSNSATPSLSCSVTATPSRSGSSTSSPSVTRSSTPSASATRSGSPTATPSRSGSSTSSPSVTRSSTPSASATRSASATTSPTRSSSATSSVTTTVTSSTNMVPSASSVFSRTVSGTGTISTSSTATSSSSPTATISTSATLTSQGDLLLDTSIATSSSSPSSTATSGTGTISTSSTATSSSSPTATISTSATLTSQRDLLLGTSIATSSSSPSSTASGTGTISTSSTATSSSSPTATISTSATLTSQRDLLLGTSIATSSSSPSSTASGTGTISTSSTATSSSSPTATISTSASSTVKSPPDVIICNFGSFLQSGSSQCTPCLANTYSYGGSSCSSCPSGSTFISSSLGCRPSLSVSNGPIDTTFYLSGSQSEGLLAFSSIINTTGGLFYYTNSTAYPSSALVVSRGSYVSAPLLPSLPIGSSAFTVSSWVKCDASSISSENRGATVISWGDPISSLSKTLTAVTLAVTSRGFLNSPTCNVSTFAGSGTSGSLNDVGLRAQFNQPQGIAVDNDGSVFVADTGNHLVRKISPNGTVTLFASGFNSPQRVVVDRANNVYVSDLWNQRICIIPASGGVCTTIVGDGTQGFLDGLGSATKIYNSRGLALNASGSLFLADTNNDRIRVISPSSFPPTFGTTFSMGTVAGSGLPGLVNGPTLSAKFDDPFDLLFDTNGDLFVADSVNNCIRKITTIDGVVSFNDSVSTFAGDQSPGFVDGEGVNARFNDPIDLAIDASDNIYVADFYNHCIRKIAPNGNVSTIAGNGIGAFSDGLGTSAQFQYPTAIDTDQQGNIYVADNGNNRIRKITFSPSLPGPLPVCDSSWHHIALTYTGSTSTNTLTAYIDGDNVASSTSLTFAISSLSTSTLRVGWNGLTPAGTAGELFSGSLSDLRIYPRSLSSSEIKLLSSGVTLSSPSPTPSATVTTSPSATVSKSPATTASSSRLISSTSSSTPLPSSSGTPSSSQSGSSTSSTSSTETPTVTFVSMQANLTSTAASTATPVFVIAVCPSGSYLQSGSTQCTSCPVNTYSYSGASSCSSCPSGSIFISSSLGCRPSSSSSSDPIDTSFYLSGSQSEGVSAFSDIVNSNGISYYSSSTSFPNTALVITSGSYVSTPLLPSLPNGLLPFFVSCWVKCDASSLTDSNPSSVVVAWGEKGEVSTSSNFTAVTLAVTSTSRMRGVTTVSTFAGSGSQGGFSDGNGVSAVFNNPSGLALDQSSGSIYVADYSNRRIRKITSTGVVSTLAGSGVSGFSDAQGTNARFNNPQGVAVDSVSGVVLVADTNNNRIRSISTTTGIVSTLAGSGVQGFADGSGVSAMFNRPFGLAVDATTGSIFVSDRNNHRIRKITSNGLVSTLAGSAIASFTDGVGTNARFNYPQGIALDTSGENVYVADSDNQRIRKITVSTGIVKTIAGSGAAGDSDGLGTDATFRSPSGISVDGVGNLYITDSNNLIRKIDVLTGMVSTIAGVSGVADFVDGASTTAMFSSPQGIVIDITGRDIFVADFNNHRIRKISTIPNLPGPLPVCDSNWHRISLSYSTTISTAIRRLANSSLGSGALTAYIDGNNFASIPATFSISSSSSTSFRIGSNGFANGELFSGSISDLRIFNRALTESELRSLSSRPSNSPGPSTTSNTTSSSSSSSMFIIIGAIAGVVILSGGGFGYYYNERRKKLKILEAENDVVTIDGNDDAKLQVIKVDSSRGVESSAVTVGDTSANWNASSPTLTSTPLSNLSSASISLASSRVTAYEDKKEPPGSTTPKIDMKSLSVQQGSQKKKASSSNNDDDDDLILATKREFPEDDDDDDAILPGALNKIKDGEVGEMAEEFNLQGLMSAVEGTVVGEAAGSLLTAASSALEGLALASISIPLVGLALKGLSMLCNQVEAFSRSNLEAEKLLGRLVRLQTVVQKASADVEFCKEHSGIFDYMVKTLNKAADKLETISKRSKFGKFIFAQSDIDIMERVDRAIMMHLTELQAAMQAQTMSMVKALHDGLLDRSSKEEEVKAPPLPPFSMRFKQSDIIFDPPLEKQLINAPRGSFGVVVFGIWKAHNLPCAVKLISSRTATGVIAVSMMSWLSEAELMRRLREHLNSVTKQTPQNICTLFGIGAVESPKTGEVTQYMVVMERLEGSLRDKLDSYLKKKRHPPLVQALTWIRDVAMGISECHDANVVHSDLKAANALLSKKNEAKLCDLGAGRVTRDMTATSSMMNSTGGGIIRGSLPWLSSELLDDQNLQPSKASDVYAWACVCWEILSCRVPYHDEEGVLAIDLNKLKNLSAIVSGKLRPDLSALRADAPSSIVEMMKRAWDPEPRDRPLIGEILETLESALSSFKDAKKGQSRRAAEAAAADLRSSTLLTQAGMAEEEDAKKAVEDLKALTKSLEEARAVRIAAIKKRHDEAAVHMRAELEAEEKRLEEEARREMALEMEKNEAMLAQRKARWIGEVNEKKEERLRNAHLLDEKDRARIVAEFELENREVEKRVEEARAEQTNRLEARLRERKEAKAKAAQKALLKLDDDADKAVEEEKNKNVHDFLLD